MNAGYQYQDMVARENDPYAFAKYKLIFKFLKARPKLKILNAGCGSGELSFLLATAGHNILGIDPSAEYIELANKRIPAELKENCSFRISSIENFNSAENYDAVIATDVLEHIKDDRGAAVKLACLLKEGGDLIISVPAMPSLFGFHDEQLGHYRRYTKKGLKKLANSLAILELKKLRYFGFTLIPICYLYSRLWKRSYPSAGKDGGFTAKFVSGVLKIMLFLDRHIPMPKGTSLVYCGKLKKVKIS